VSLVTSQECSSTLKDKVAPLLNELRTMPLRHVTEWRYSSIILDLGTISR
jgi:hypothetical protein